MPKTNFCKPKDVVGGRLDFFAGWLAGQMKLNGLTGAQIGEWLGCSRQNVSYKIEKRAFTLEDIIIIFDKMDISAEDVGAILTWGKS